MHTLRSATALLVLNLLAAAALTTMPRLVQGQAEIPEQYLQPCCASGKEANYCCTDCCSKKTCSGSKTANKECPQKAT